MAIQPGKNGSWAAGDHLERRDQQRQPSYKEIPGAAARTASKSMISPNDCLCRRPINQPKVKWFPGASSRNSCKITEAGITARDVVRFCANSGLLMSGTGYP